MSPAEELAPLLPLPPVFRARPMVPRLLRGEQDPLRRRRSKRERKNETKSKIITLRLILRDNNNAICTVGMIGWTN